MVERPRDPAQPVAAQQRLAALKASTILQAAPDLELRPLRPEDVTPAYVAGLNDEAATRLLTDARQSRHTLESQRAYVRQKWENRDGILFGVYRHDELCGTLRLHDIDFVERTAFVGILLFDRRVWGQGVGTAVLRAVVDFARNALELRRLIAGIYEVNEPSVRLFERCGFRRRPETRTNTDRGPASRWWLEITA